MGPALPTPASPLAGGLRTARVFVAPAAVAELDGLACSFVSGLLRVSLCVLRGHAAFPSLEALGLCAAQAALVRARPPDDANELFVLGRLDVNTDGRRALSYEFNGDQPGALAPTAQHCRAAASRRAGAEPQVTPEFRGYLGAALRLFRARTGRAAPEGVLLLDRGYLHVAFEAAELTACFGAASSVLVRQGPEGCRFVGGALLCPDAEGRPRRVDLVLRTQQVSTRELASEPYAPVREAYLAGVAVLVNPPHARVPGCKALYAALGDRRLQALAGLRSDEVAAIERLLPCTLRVDAAERGALHGERERWVFKGALGGRGRNVHFGADLSAEAWARLLAEAGPGCTVQRYATPLELEVELDDAPGVRLRCPGSVDPYLTGGDRLQVIGHLVRVAVPAPGQPAALGDVKLNLGAVSSYADASGARHARVVALGRLDWPPSPEEASR